MTKHPFSSSRTLIAVLLSGLLLLGCEEDGTLFDCVRHDDAKIISVTGPTQIEESESADFLVDFGVTNGCGQFNKFKESKDGNTYEIIVKAIYKGCICTQDAPIITVPYSFDPPRSGTYFLRFRQDKSEWITRKVEVK